jgi:hypothetical protein
MFIPLPIIQSYQNPNIMVNKPRPLLLCCSAAGCPDTVALLLPGLPALWRTPNVWLQRQLLEVLVWLLLLHWCCPGGS